MTDTLNEVELIVETMPIDLVRPAPDNPRDTLGELAELTDSIESNGILQPLIVKGTGELGDDDREVVLVIAGHRRLAAARLAELSTVPVIVRNDIDEADRQAAMFVENFHRLDLGPIERARALKQLADAGVPQKDIAARVGVTQPTVSKSLALLKLPVKAQEFVSDGRMTQEDAVALASLPKEKVTELSKDGPPPDWRIANAKREVEREKAHAIAVKEVEAKGWKVLDEDPDYFQQLELEGNQEPVALDDDRHSPEGTLAHIDPTEHESEPCHAVHIDGNGGISPACTNPGSHPKPEGWKSPFELEMEAVRAEKAGAPESNGPASRGKVPATAARRLLDESRARIIAAVGPIKELCTKILTENIDPKMVVDFGVVAMLRDEDWNATPVGDLLGLTFNAYDVDPLVDAIEADGEIDGLKVIHAWGLANGLSALEELADLLVRGHDIDETENCVVDSHKMLEHIGRLYALDSPTFDQFVTQVKAGDESPDGEAPTVEVYVQRGKYKRRCSECGDLDGQNTAEDLANERAVQHLKEKHGIEVAA